MKIGTIVSIAVFSASITLHAQERGKAYLYPLEHEGQKTASGEIFQQAALTGGHARLPFGTIIRVTDVWTGKAVDVRINDRRSHPSQLIRISRAAGEQLGILQHGVADVTIQIVRPAPPTEAFSFKKKEKTEGGGLFSFLGKNKEQAASAHDYPQSTQPLATRQTSPPIAAGQNAQVEPILVPLAAPTAGSSRFWLQFASFPDKKSAKEFAQLIRSRGAPTRVISDPNGLKHRVVSDHFFGSRQEADSAAERTARKVGFHSIVQGR